MPVEFLSDEEAAAFGRLSGAPSQAELDRAFFLDDVDRALIARRRGAHNRLGFALQLTTVRSLGTFLADPLDVPSVVLEYLAEQLEVADPSCVKRYTERRATRFEHAEEIKDAYGLRDFAEVEGELERWVEARAWTTGDGPKAIFNDAVGWLSERGVLLPGVTTLARLVARVRDGAALRLWDILHGLITGRQRLVLEGLLEVPDGARFSDLERWRKGAGEAVGEEPGAGAHPGLGDPGRGVGGAGCGDGRAVPAPRRPGPLRDGSHGGPAAPAPAVTQDGDAAGHRGVVPGGQSPRRRLGTLRLVDGHRAAGQGRARGQGREGASAPGTGEGRRQTRGRDGRAVGGGRLG